MHMKHKIFARICGLVLVLGCIFSINLVKANERTAGETERLISGLLEFKQTEAKAESNQAWLDSYACEQAGQGVEWYIFALSNYDGRLNFNEYKKALRTYVTEKYPAGAVERERIALALVLLGEAEDSFVLSTANDAIGAQGIMSYVFGLHLLNNGVKSTLFTGEELVKTILSLQKEDGGWTVIGQYSDVDVTAMTLQALAANRESSDDELLAAISKALKFLSDNQTENGGYKSYGKENAESSAQVLLALISLGIDFEKDEAFIKNGYSVLDAIRGFALENGAFAHEKGGEANEIATEQVLCALVEAEKKCNIFIYTATEESEPEPTGEVDKKPLTVTPAVTAKPTTAAQSTGTGTAEGINTRGLYKIPASIIVVCIALLACLIQLLRGKRHVKNYLFIAGIGLALILLIWATDFESKDSFYNKKQTKNNVIGTVTLSIRCDTIVGRADYVPINGIILETSEFEIEEGDSVYDILLEAAAKYNLQLVHKGTPATAYISSINSIAELDFGDLSGWMYMVNGYMPSVSCGIYKPEDGDIIEWKYTCNLGEDLK